MITVLNRAARRAKVHTESSPRCEDYGVDFLWRHPSNAWYGVQRKEINDFIASLNDGRLTKEIGQMKATVTRPIVLIEGKVRFINDTLTSVHGYSTKDISERSWRGRLLTLMHMGVHVAYSDDHTDTAKWVVDYYQWSRKTQHSTATTRPGPVNEWGTLKNRDFQIHLLTALPGVGPLMAERIIETIGWPMSWTVGIEELLRVPGIGPKMAQKITRVFKDGPKS